MIVVKSPKELFGLARPGRMVQFRQTRRTRRETQRREVATRRTTMKTPRVATRRVGYMAMLRDQLALSLGKACSNSVVALVPECSNSRPFPEILFNAIFEEEHCHALTWAGGRCFTFA